MRKLHSGADIFSFTMRHNFLLFCPRINAKKREISKEKSIISFLIFLLFVYFRVYSRATSFLKLSVKTIVIFFSVCFPIYLKIRFFRFPLRRKLQNAVSSPEYQSTSRRVFSNVRSDAEARILKRSSADETYFRRRTRRPYQRRKVRRPVPPVPDFDAVRVASFV